MKGLGFMLKAHVLRSITALAAAGMTAVSAAAGAPPAWELVWSDEFNGTAVDPAKWHVENAFLVKNNELQHYAPDDVSVAGGLVTLRSQQRSFMGRNYTSGLIDTQGRFQFRYGRVEGRMRIPRGQGIWPAFWMAPADGRWPPEIDMMESIGNPNTVYMTHHWGASCTQHTFAGNPFTGPDYSQRFAVFAVEWFPDRIDWYIDGVLRRTTTTAIPNVPMFIILNTAVGGDWPGNPNATTVFPQVFEIDYVRVFKRADLPPEQPAPAGFQNGGFEVCGGVVNTNNTVTGRPFWSWINSGNVFSDTGTRRNGTRGVKMFGRFTGSSNFSSLTQTMSTPVPPFAKVRLTGFARENGNDALAGTNNAVARINWLNAGGGEVGFVESTVLTGASPNDQWLSFTLTTPPIPAGATAAVAQLRFNQPTGTGSGAAFFDDVQLTVLPCRAEFNGDGQFTPADIFAFLNAFFARDFVNADIDGNGFLEPQDIFTFLNLYFARCV
jgi:beta-glucanase (GH16 family)